MELFTVNRYLGDEEETADTPNAEKLRKKLLKKIEKRKRCSERHVDEQEEEDGEICKKRSKNENLENEEPESVDQDSTPTVKKKKKKKSKNETQDADESNGKDVESKAKGSDDESDENDENDDNEPVSLEDQTAFTILKNVEIAKKEKVKRKLPGWLANPSVVSVDLKNLTHPIDSIPSLDKLFVDKLKANGITHFFPVQYQVIPCILENDSRPYMFWPNDICVSAPTGSGKTLAFVLPILQILHKRIVPKIRALVVLPVQDLANQIFKVFETYSKGTSLKILLLTKKRPFEDEQKLICRADDLGNCKTLVDIVVTTPGRLVEHLTKTKGLDLSELKYLVIDEADRVMEHVQNDWLYHLNKHINSECTRSYQIPVITYNNMNSSKRPPNKLLFSATLSQDPEKLQQLGLFQPKLYTSVVKSRNSGVNGCRDESKFIGKFTTPAELKEFYAICSTANKPLFIHHLIQSKMWKSVLCFVNSASATSKLAFVLRNLSKKQINVSQLSGNLSIQERDLVLKKFSEGKIDVLISSDALARGIDIPNVQYVISYDCPKFVKTYVHRIGRTGRAGKEGTSLTVLTTKEEKKFNGMVMEAGKNSLEKLPFDETELEEYESEYKKALASLGKHLEKEKVDSLSRKKTSKKLQVLARKGTFLSKTKKKKIKIHGQKKKLKNK